jgi:hypothetical protein
MKFIYKGEEKIKEYRKEYYQKNKEKIKEYHVNNKEKNKEKRKEYYKEYDKNRDKNKIKIRQKINYEKNKEKIKEQVKEYNINNKEKIKEYNKTYRKNNKEKININNKNRKKINPLFKLMCNIRTRIRTSIIKKGYTKQSKTYQILGCSYEDFKQHIERQFTKGMTWENQGQWHLDHIYPVSLAKDEQELIRLNHYTNFQPMWALENIIKGKKIIPNTQIKLI